MLLLEEEIKNSSIERRTYSLLQMPCAYANADRGTGTNAMIFQFQDAPPGVEQLCCTRRPCLPQALHMDHTMFSRIRNVTILGPAAMLVSHKLLDLGIVVWALRWPRNLGLILWCWIVVSLTKNFAYSRHILGHFYACEISLFIRYN